jgi:NAD(P)H-hydrate epimerase
MIPEISRDKVPALSTDQMREVDRAMMEDYSISLLQMMENAGRGLAHLARIRFFDGDPRDKSALVLAGPGGNGGGALACGRRLANWGSRLSVVLSAPREKYGPVPAHQLRILDALGVTVVDAVSGRSPEVHDQELIVDGLIGYSLTGPPREPVASLIRWTHGRAAPVVSLDVPTGVDSSSGKIHDPAVRATATLTLALPKTGLLADGAAAHVGELYLADISVPPELYRGRGLEVEVGHLFAESDILRIV